MYWCIKAYKIDEYLNIKNCSHKKCLIVQLLLEQDNEIPNKTKNSLDDKNESCVRNNCLIHKISLVLLVAITITQKIGLKRTRSMTLKQSESF